MDDFRPYVSYDIRHLNSEAERMGLSPLLNASIDTMLLSRDRFTDNRNHTLLDLLRVLGLSDHEEHHVLSDAIQTWRCYKLLMSSDGMLEWTDSLEKQSKQTSATKDSLFLKDLV